MTLLLVFPAFGMPGRKTRRSKSFWIHNDFKSSVGSIKLLQAAPKEKKKIKKERKKKNNQNIINIDLHSFLLFTDNRYILKCFLNLKVLFL